MVFMKCRFEIKSCMFEKLAKYNYKYVFFEWIKLCQSMSVKRTGEASNTKDLVLIFKI